MSMTSVTMRNTSAIAAGPRDITRSRDRLSLILLVAMVYCTTQAINEVGWAEGTGFLVWDGFMAVFLASVLAASRVPVWLSSLIGSVVGLEWVLVSVGNLWPPIAYVRADWQEIGFWVDKLRWGSGGFESPMPRTAGYIGRQAHAMTIRLWVWFWRAATGQKNADERVWLLLVATGVFFVTFFAGWHLLRHCRAPLAVLPLGAALGVNSFLAGQRPTWVLAFTGLALGLLVRANVKGLEHRWVSQAMDYSDELITSATLLGMGLAIMSVAISPIVPAISSRATYEAFWRSLRRPWQKVEDTTGRLFGGLNSPGRSSLSLRGGPASPDYSGGHPMGASRPLGDQVVMYVKTDDPAPEPWVRDMPELERETIPQRHWRGATYETYTGTGWKNRPTVEKAWEANAELPVSEPAGRKEFHQHFRGLGRGDVIYAAGQPYTVNVPTRSRNRDDLDIVSLTSSSFQYDVVSLVPDLTVDDLEAAGEEYPEWVVERYLALPPIPDRVVATAKEITRDTRTPYQAARAIEAYLRQFPYDLDVPAPPQGRDAVDYFLFEAQRGYCDYYATAMTVLLRASGVPARLAVGYARGTFDDRLGEWVITERDAHAWVEVYFPTYGWIEFEPTASQETYRFPVGGLDEFEPPPVAPLPPPDTGLKWPFGREQTTVGAVVAGLLAVLGVTLARVIRRTRYSSDDWIQLSYVTVVKAASWIGIVPSRSETVREFWARLRTSLSQEALVVSLPWGSEWVWEFGRLSNSLRYVLAAYERSLFSPARLGRNVAMRARQEASRVRHGLAMLWLARRLGE